MKAAVNDLYEMGKSHSSGNLTTSAFNTYSVMSSPITRSLTLASKGNYIIVFSAGEGSDGHSMSVSNISVSNGTVNQLYKNATYTNGTWKFTQAVSIAFIEVENNCTVSVTSQNTYTQAQTGAIYFFGAIKLS